MDNKETRKLPWSVDRWMRRVFLPSKLSSQVPRAVGTLIDKAETGSVSQARGTEIAAQLTTISGWNWNLVSALSSSNKNQRFYNNISEHYSSQKQTKLQHQWAKGRGKPGQISQQWYRILDQILNQLEMQVDEKELATNLQAQMSDKWTLYHMELHRSPKILIEDAALRNLCRPLPEPSSCSYLLPKIGKSLSVSSEAKMKLHSG